MNPTFAERSPRTVGPRAPRRGRRTARSSLLVLAAVALACAPTVEIARPPEGFAVDPDVRALVAEKLAAVEAAPGSAEAHGVLGLAYEANQLWSLAHRSFGAAATLAPKEPTWTLHEAVCLREAGDAEGALALLRKAAAALPREPSAHERLGQAALAAGELAEAEAAFRRVVAVARDSAEGHLGLAEVALARGDFEAARASAAAAVERAPAHRGAHFALGQALQGLGRSAEAERELSLGVGATVTWLPLPRSADLRRFGISYADKIARSVDAMDAGAPQAAATILEGLRARRPDDVNVLNNLGAAYTVLKRHEEAEAVLRHALEVDAERFETHINLARSLLERARLKEALEHADAAVGLAPEMGRAHYTRAQILAYQGEFPRAYAAMRRSAELDARDPMIHVALGELSMRLEVWAEARAHFEDAVERMPDHLPSHVNLVKSLIETGAMAEADKRLQLLEANVQDLPMLQNLRAQVPRRP